MFRNEGKIWENFQETLRGFRRMLRSFLKNVQQFQKNLGKYLRVHEKIFRNIWEKLKENLGARKIRSNF